MKNTFKRNFGGGILGVENGGGNFFIFFRERVFELKTLILVF